MLRCALVAMFVVSACGNREASTTEGSSTQARSSTGSSTGGASTAAWPVAPGPTLPPELATLAWPPTIDDMRARFPTLESDTGVTITSAPSVTVAFAETVPSTFPRIWLRSDLNLMHLEAVWGQFAKSRDGQPMWWNPQTRMRARFDAAHSNPKNGRGIELAPYVSTIDRVAKAPVDFVAGQLPPGEWDLAPVVVTTTPLEKNQLRIQFVVRADAPPVDAIALLGVLRAKWGEPNTEVSEVWTYAKGTVSARRQSPQPSFEITYVVRRDTTEP